MKTLIKKLLREAIIGDTIICDSCGHKSDKKDSELHDLYICHECQYDNTPTEESLTEIDDKNQTVGVLIKCVTTNTVFLLKRNDPPPKKQTWSLMSGTMDTEENSQVISLEREMEEELGISPKLISVNDYKEINPILEKRQGVIVIKKKGIEKKGDRNFYYYEGFTNTEFSVNLAFDKNNENLDYGWFSIDDLPEPLYDEGLRYKIIDILNNNLISKTKEKVV